MMLLIPMESRNTIRQRMVTSALVVVASLCAVLCSGLAQAQPITRAVPFTLSAQDTTSSAYLPHIEAGPAGKHGAWHLSPDGHFEAADGTRIRFVGTELDWNAVYQTGESAHILAQRLAKMGFNAVKLNNFDYWGYDDYSFFRTYDDQGKIEPTSYVVNALQLARLDTLIYELKQAGIYTFFTIHAYHRYSYGDGVPTYDSAYGNTFLMPVFYKEAAGLEHDYVRMITSHVDPLLGHSFGSDPAIACYDIAQEWTLPWWWELDRMNYVDSANVLTRGLYTISYHQSRHLDTLYADFLKAKYGTDAAIDHAWRGDPSSDTSNLIRLNASFEKFDLTGWDLLNYGLARSSTVLATPGEDGSPGVMIHPTQVDTSRLYYGNMFYNSSARMGKDSLYTYTLWAKIRFDPANPVYSRQLYGYVASAQTGAANLYEAFTIDTSWKKYTFTFRATYDGIQRVGLLFPGDPGDILLDNFDVRHAQEAGLQFGESLTGSSIARLRYTDMSKVSAMRAADETRFYLELEDNYYSGIQNELRDTLKVAGLINRTQTNYWGTVLDFYPNSKAEVTAVHTGWDYVSSRPGSAYSDSLWMIRNYSLAKDQGFSTLAIAAAGAAVGKAHILEEWAVPNVNQSSSENALIPLAYASLQDWDGIFFSPYANYRAEVFADTIIPGYASYAWDNVAPNHAFLSLLPAASYAYRHHEIATSDVTDTIKHNAADVWDFPHYLDTRGVFGQEGYTGGDYGIVTFLKVRQMYDTKEHQVAAENHYLPGDTLNTSETGQIQYVPTHDYFTVQTPWLYGYTGFPTGPITFPTLTVVRLDGSSDILSFYYQMDSATNTALLSASTRTQNTGMVWADTLGYSNNYGHAPTIMSAAKLQLTITSAFDSVLIQPLDSTGNAVGKEIAAEETAPGSFTVTIDQLETPSTWFHIRQANIPASVASNTISAEKVRILENPVRNSLQLLANYPMQSVEIVDALGRTMNTMASGSTRATVDLSSVASGAYTAIIAFPNGTRITKRISVVH